MYEVIYEDQRIRLRKATYADAEGLYRLLNDPDIMIYYGESELSRAYASEEIDWFNSLFNENGGRWVIEDKETGLYIGDVGMSDYTAKHRKGEIGFKLDKAYWQKGIMSLCIQVILKIAFEDWGYNRVEAIADVRNIGCKTLLSKNGFTKEGTMRESEFEHGAFVDLEMYLILKREFEAFK